MLCLCGQTECYTSVRNLKSSLSRGLKEGLVSITLSVRESVETESKDSRDMSFYLDYYILSWMGYLPANV